MKNKFSFMIGFFIIGVILGGLFSGYSYASERQSLLDGITDNLIEVTKEKTDKINLYFSGMEEDIQILQKSDEVKRLLKQELVFDESIIKKDVDERSRVIIKEAENYLRAHPEMTLEDLQETKEFHEIVVQPIGKGDTEFQEIIVQPVGKEGYSFAFDSQTLINYFHKEPRRIGYNYNDIEKTFPQLWKIFKETSKDGSSEGFYYRDEPDGSVSYKYGKFVQIPVKTADGITISLGTTAYVKDYRIIKESSDYLENFNELQDHHNLVLVSSEGCITYQVEKKIGLGTNLEWEVNLNSGFSKTYFDTKESNQASFGGPFIRYYGEIYPKIFLMAPVYDESKLLGYITIIDEMARIFEITEDIKNLGEEGETYLVNDEQLLISPLRNHNFDIMIQSIDTPNLENCLSMGEMGVHEDHKEITSFTEYAGEKVIGAHEVIPRMKWCLISEIHQEEVVDAPLRENIKKKLFALLLGVLILTLIGFFVGKHFDKRKRKTKKISKIEKFFTRLKLRYSFLFSLIFAIGYFFLITFFFQGWREGVLFDIVPDFIFFIIAFSILAYALKLKNKSRKFLIWGAGLLCLVKLYELPLQELQVITTISPFLWYPSMIVTVLSFLLILVFFREVSK